MIFIDFHEIKCDILNHNWFFLTGVENEIASVVFDLHGDTESEGGHVHSDTHTEGEIVQTLAGGARADGEEAEKARNRADTANGGADSYELVEH